MIGSFIIIDRSGVNKCGVQQSDMELKLKQAGLILALFYAIFNHHHAVYEVYVGGINLVCLAKLRKMFCQMYEGLRAKHCQCFPPSAIFLLGRKVIILEIILILYFTLLYFQKDLPHQPVVKNRQRESKVSILLIFYRWSYLTNQATIRQSFITHSDHNIHLSLNSRLPHTHSVFGTGSSTEYQSYLNRNL